MPTAATPTLQELKAEAFLWWPEEIVQKVEAEGIFAKLLGTFDPFVSIIKLSTQEPGQILAVARAARFRLHRLLAHLMILSDFGKESLKRLRNNYREIFGQDSAEVVFRYLWRQTVQEVRLPDFRRIVTPAKLIDPAFFDLDIETTEREGYAELVLLLT